MGAYVLNIKSHIQVAPEEIEFVMCMVTNHICEQRIKFRGEIHNGSRLVEQKLTQERTSPARRKEVRKPLEHTTKRTTAIKSWKRRYRNDTLNLSWLKQTLFIITIWGLFETTDAKLTRMEISVGRRSMKFHYSLPITDEIVIRCIPFSGGIRVCAITANQKHCTCDQLLENHLYTVDMTYYRKQTMTFRGKKPQEAIREVARAEVKIRTKKREKHKTLLHDECSET